MMSVLSFFFSPIGRYVAIGIVILAALGGIYAKGRSDGASAVQSKWDAAVQAATERGADARREAERTIDGNGNAVRVPNDKFDRDRGAM